MKETRQNADKIIIRVPDGMRPALKARAATNNRSTNMEIVTILENALRGEAADRGQFGDGTLTAAGTLGALAGSQTSTRY